MTRRWEQATKKGPMLTSPTAEPEVASQAYCITDSGQVVRPQTATSPLQRE